MRLLTCALLAVIVFAAFSPALRNGFVGYDDPEYVTENPHVNTGLSWANISWAFTAAHSSNWHPITWLSHALDCALFGLNPTAHHAVSLLLHVANTILLFLWLNGVTGSLGFSAFVAAVFGLHPLHVESVAWISERKDVLSTLFWLLTLIAYTSYAKRPSLGRYALVASLLTLGLMSKQMLVSLPIVLLLVDWWPLERKPAVLEKIPLLALSAAASGAAFWAQRHSGSVTTTEALPIALRLSNAVVSYLEYLRITIWPSGLAVFYPFPVNGVAAWKVAVSLLLIAAVSWMAYLARDSWPWITVGWFWYLVTLLPVIGIVQVGMQARADRYMYVPMIGLLIPVAWECAVKWGGSRGAWVVACAALLACAAVSWRQTHFWKDGVVLFTHAVDVTTDNFVAHDNLGVELDRRGRYDEALAHYRETLRIKPDDRNGQANYAMANFAKGARLFDAGKLNESLAAFEEGSRYTRGNAMAHMYTGLIRTQRQELSAAIAELRQAVEIDPTLAQAHMGLGVALAYTGNAAEAARAFAAVVRYDPSNVQAHYDLGLALAALDRGREALASFDAALRIKTDFAPAIAARAQLMAQLRGR